MEDVWVFSDVLSETTWDIFWKNHGREWRMPSYDKIIVSAGDAHWVSPDGKHVYNVDPKGHSHTSPSIAGRHHDYKYNYYTYSDDAKDFLFDKGWVRTRVTEGEADIEAISKEAVLKAIQVLSWVDMQSVLWFNPKTEKSETIPLGNEVAGHNHAYDDEDFEL